MKLLLSSLIFVFGMMLIGCGSPDHGAVENSDPVQTPESVSAPPSPAPVPTPVPNPVSTEPDKKPAVQVPKPAGRPPVTMQPIPDDPPVVVTPSPAPAQPPTQSTPAVPRPIGSIFPKAPPPPVSVIPDHIRFAASLLLNGASLKDIKPGGYVRPTVYYKPIIRLNDSECASSELVNMENTAGQVIVKVCPKVRKLCLMQGSCMLIKGDKEYFLNYNSAGKFFLVKSDKCPYGYGVKNSCLDPFYTVAADDLHFKAGDVIFIPRLVGLLLPNNKRHHGFFIVRDEGGMINGESRFDFFSGFIRPNKKNNPFTPIGLADKRTRVEYYKVSGTTADMIRKDRNYPSMPELDRQAGIGDADDIVDDLKELENDEAARLPAKTKSQNSKP